jgi:hypothetical protein
MNETTDPNDPRLGHGTNDERVPQNRAYLVLSEAERGAGFVRPVRTVYRHVGDLPKHPLRDLTPDEKERYKGCDYVKFEKYPDGDHVLGRYWTNEQLAKGACGSTTTINSRAIAETYARDPHFYGSTYCVQCGMHLPVAEFVWEGTDQKVGS